MGMNMYQQYGNLPVGAQDAAVTAHLVTDVAIALLPFKVKASPAAASAVADAAEVANVAQLPARLVRVIPEEYASSSLGRTGAADVFVTAPDAIKGLDAAGISKKLTLQDGNGNPVKGPFRLIEFDTPTEGLAQPYNRGNNGFVNGGKTAGGVTEYMLPNAKIKDLSNVKQTTVK